MSLRAGIACILSPEPVLRHHRQMVGSDAGQRRADDLVADDAEAIPRIEAIETEERKARREGAAEVHAPERRVDEAAVQGPARQSRRPVVEVAAENERAVNAGERPVRPEEL